MLSILSAVLLAAVPATPPQKPADPPPSLKHVAALEVIQKEKGVWQFQGDVEVTAGEEQSAVRSDNAEYRQATNELRLTGKVRVTDVTQPVVTARTARHLPDGGTAWRGNVRAPFGSHGLVLRADEADFHRDSSELQLRGNVRIEDWDKAWAK